MEGGLGAGARGAPHSSSSACSQGPRDGRREAEVGPQGQTGLRGPACSAREGQAPRGGLRPPPPEDSPEVASAGPVQAPPAAGPRVLAGRGLSGPRCSRSRLRFTSEAPFVPANAVPVSSTMAARELLSARSRPPRGRRLASHRTHSPWPPSGGCDVEPLKAGESLPLGQVTGWRIKRPPKEAGGAESVCVGGAHPPLPQAAGGLGSQGCPHPHPLWPRVTGHHESPWRKPQRSEGQGAGRRGPRPPQLGMWQRPHTPHTPHPSQACGQKATWEEVARGGHRSPGAPCYCHQGL